ncbi:MULTISPECIES: flagellar hook protein FlgE [unclassified Bradyrhizobium]|uniref:flagellar hook protein FlgE n=1 Tax=unclassified Bradyrhizobium TaxID=2631580 RepID=UPI001BA8854C|nr:MULTISPECIES: flagellar hook-basal body complex protein [unclassified Bradyrhizobium]MBR1142278.1 flagellar hook-basal body complex protein [Bradyrhizobium sp. AUGA SZCCT0431]MBR1156852.1 flagellar hook-basal body complex protein [Bradyrhizobium sp. JYMT SZCCT0428]MBR1226492.1 flagellar hook-basal body complex protein [Bradyrhizobium sp. AUGA SZCCT0176]MBR1237743.1 flagellar hook-basal body complex protein [Bradyrhizobium sp. AUGA SZCCT0182]MBR1268746.1 flagellar hook-basal body complex pro
MGIFGALTTSVAGLRANSYALENISGNIANSQTTAFKRIDTSFMDIIPDTGSTAQLAGSVTAGSRSTNTIAGSVQSAAVSTYMAINGDGFFAVQKPGSISDNNPVFDGINRYTRRGDFSLDKNGYLVNGAGYYLEGVPIDPTTGNPSGSVPQVLRFQNDFLPSQATTKIDYRANLASYPLTNKHDTSVPGSELLRPADFISNPRILGTPATPYSNTAVLGNARNNYETIPQPISAGTLLTSTSGTNSLPAGFANGDTLVLKTTTGGVTTTNTLSFYTGAAPAPVAGTTFIDLATATVGGLLTTIDGLTGGAPASSVSAAGAITLNTGTTNDFTLAAGASASAVSAFQALGFTGTVTGLRGGGGTAGTGIVIGSDNKAFLDESISGGTSTAYDGNGAPVALQFRWAKVESATQGATDTWNLFYQVNPGATGNTVSWQNVGTDFKFGTNGQMQPVVGQITLTGLTVAGTSLGNVTMAFGTGGLTQFADTNGNAQVNQLQQDGYAAGQLQSVSVSNEGRVVGSYSNGRNIDLAEVSVATFNGADFLKRIDGGAFEVTNESGEALYGKGGNISGSSLESSNTDIADEFTKLIVTQQAYSANTKVITTANTMVQDLLNVMR